MSVKMLIDLEVGRSEGLDWWILTWWSLTSAEKEDISGNLWCIPQVLNSHFFTANFILLHLVFITHVEYTLFKQILKISFCPKKEKRMGEICYLSSVQFSCSVIFNSLWPPGLQHARPPCPSPTPGVYSNWHPLSRWCNSISPLSYPSPPAFNLSQHQGLFKWVCSLPQVAKVLEFQLQRQSFQWIFWFDFL